MTVEVIYLASNQVAPDFSDDERWLTVEANEDGKFYGTGWSQRPSGEGVAYMSLAEDDFSLEAALRAAQAWAAKYGVDRIWVTPDPPPQVD